MKSPVPQHGYGNRRRGALRITSIYLLVGALWILFSDRIAAQTAPTPAVLTTISIYKGWGFIVVTSVMLYLLISQNNRALSRSEERLLTLTNALPVLISYIDADRRYGFANQAYEEWFGHEAAGWEVVDVVGEPAYQKISPYMDKALAGQTVIYETEATFANAGTRFISSTYVPDRDTDGNVRGFFALVQDITERKQDEMELRQWADAFEHCAHGIALGDPSSNRILLCNSAFAALHKARIEDIVGMSILGLYAPVDHDHVRQGVARADQVGHSQYKAHMIRRDGSTFPVQMDVVSVQGDDGEILYRVATAQDITERNKAEREIAHQASILQHINDAVILSDQDWNITGWNTAAERMYGWKAEEIIGRKGQAVLGTEFFQTTREDILQRLQNVGEFSAEVSQLRKDGTRFFVETHSVAMPAASGHTRHIVSVNRDITERKRSEEEVRQLNEKLEERVIQRTAQLHAANKELEAFSYSVSHDLRAPLRAISGYAQILVEDYSDVLGNDGKRVCGVITAEARRMGELIDDLLSFSRLSRKEMQASTVDMKSLAFSVFGELTTEAQRERIDLSIGKLPQAIGDAALLHQVWINLISNAIKFTSKKDRALIEVGTKRSEDRLVYFVRDNGAGFNIQYVDKLFGVFQRLHSEDEFDGTGVGLAIVQRIIQRHGGNVWAEGEVDKGATFYFALPRETENP